MPNRITSDEMRLQNRRQSVGGYRDPPSGKAVEVEKLPHSVQGRLKRANINEDEYLKMLYFAKYQPRGHRKLNDENLTSMVIGESEAPMTDTQGLRRGGEVANTMLQNNSRKPLKEKPLGLTIKNNNRLKTNPNFTSFKNNFKLGSN